MTTLYAPLPTLNLIVENYDNFFQIVWSKQNQTSTESPPLLAFFQWMLKSFHSFIETSLKRGNLIPQLHMITTLFKNPKQFYVCFESEGHERNNFGRHVVFLDEI